VIYRSSASTITAIAVCIGLLAPLLGCSSQSHPSHVSTALSMQLNKPPPGQMSKTLAMPPPVFGSEPDQTMAEENPGFGNKQIRINDGTPLVGCDQGKAAIGLDWDNNRIVCVNLPPGFTYSLPYLEKRRHIYIDTIDARDCHPSDAPRQHGEFVVGFNKDVDGLACASSTEFMLGSYGNPGSGGQGHRDGAVFCPVNGEKPVYLLVGFDIRQRNVLCAQMIGWRYPKGMTF
jgi:hypothetical protein